jgi:hypothetical protein
MTWSLRFHAGVASAAKLEHHSSINWWGRENDDDERAWPRRPKPSSSSSLKIDCFDKTLFSFFYFFKDRSSKSWPFQEKINANTDSVHSASCVDFFVAEPTPKTAAKTQSESLELRRSIPGYISAFPVFKSFSILERNREKHTHTQGKYLSTDKTFYTLEKLQVQLV